MVSGLLLMQTACGPAGAGPDNNPNNAVATLTIATPAPGLQAIQVNQTLQLNAEARSADDRVLVGPTLHWSSDNSVIATVSSTGQVTGLSTGTTSIKVASGSANASVSVRVLAEAATRVEISTPGAPLVVATEFPALATAYSPSNQPVAISGVRWTSSHPSVLTVSSTGRVRAVGVGSSTIRAEVGDIIGEAVFETRPAGLAITTQNLSLGPLDSVLLPVVAHDALGNLIVPTPPVEWSSSDNNFVRVNAQGWAVGVDAPPPDGGYHSVVVRAPPVDRSPRPSGPPTAGGVTT
jgi:hypothetical protein